MGRQALEKGRGVRGDEEKAREQPGQPPRPPRHRHDPARRPMLRGAHASTRHVLGQGCAQTDPHRNTAHVCSKHAGTDKPRGPRQNLAGQQGGPHPPSSRGQGRHWRGGRAGNPTSRDECARGQVLGRTWVSAFD